MADSGSDNPILDMGLLGMMQPNPYINPAYAGKPLKLPGFYTGSAGDMPPTDASGKPIQSFVDANNAAQSTFNQNQTPPAGTTTLNATGQQPAGGGSSLMNTPAMQQLSANYQAAQAAKSPQQLQTDAQNDQMRQQMLQQQATMSQVQAGNGGFGNMPGGAFNSGSYMPTQLPAAPAAAPAAGGATPPSSPDMRQAYLDALAAPQGIGGHVPISGAAVPASNPLGTPSVLNAFMAAHPSGGAKGAGNYDNSGFFSTLSNLKSA